MSAQRGQDTNSQEPDPYAAVGFDELVDKIERAKDRLLADSSLTVDERADLYIDIVTMIRTAKRRLTAAHDRTVEIFGRSPYDAL